MTGYEEDISAEQYKAQEKPWVSQEDEYGRWKKYHKKTESKRPEKAERLKGGVLSTDLRLTREHRLRKGADIKRVMDNGEVLKSRHFLVFITRGEGKYTRLGLAVGKKIGKAHTRNYIKRRIREYFRHARTQLEEGALDGTSDVVILARQGADKLDYHQISEELNSCFRKRPPRH